MSHKAASEKLTFTTIEWSLLIKPLIFLFLSLILSLLIILACQQYYSYLTNWNQEQNQKFRRNTNEHYQLQQALDIVNNRYLETFRDLKTVGFFQDDTHFSVEEHRVKMIDEIKGILSQLSVLFNPSYELSKTTFYAVPELIIEEEFKTYETPLTLKMGLLHEEDVLNLVETIEFHYKRFAGLFNLQYCEIERLKTKINMKQTSQPNFEANCLLIWYISKIELEEEEE